MGWGFGWKIAPFAMWDLLGFAKVIEDMKQLGLVIPEWVKKLQDSNIQSFYNKDITLNETTSITKEACQSESCFTSAIVHNHNDRILLGNPYDEIRLSSLKTKTHNLLWQNSESTLIDLDDNVVLFEINSKGNTLSFKVVEGLLTVLEMLPYKPWRGLIIGNDSGNFSAGANLLEMAMLVKSGEFAKVAEFLDKIQHLMLKIRYSPKPVVAAVEGLAIGGGCELVMASPHVVAASESYIGLVEMGVGLIPGAGGLMNMATYASEKAATHHPSDLYPFLKKVFETVGMAKVSNSATEAIDLGFLPCNTHLVMNSDRKIFVAKELVLYLDKEGYLPPPENNIFVAGKSGRAMLEMMSYTMKEGGFISEYDQYLANKLAYVLTGGDIDAPTYVSETYMLKLEKEAFLPLLKQPKTQARVEHMLKTKKALRN